MNARLPWFPMYVSDWLLSHSVRLMTPEQRGIYVQLLCEQWQNGGTLPDDDPQLQILSGATTEQWLRSKDAVLKNFDHHDGTLFNKRLRQEMENRETWQAKLSEAGKRGMAKRWAKDSDTAPKPEPAGKTRQATQIPADFAITDAHRKLAAELGIDADAELPKFIGYYTAHGKAMKNWNAAFGNWLRNAPTFGGATAPAKSIRMVNPADLVRAELEAK